MVLAHVGSGECISFDMYMIFVTYFRRGKINVALHTSFFKHRTSFYYFHVLFFLLFPSIRTCCSRHLSTIMDSDLFEYLDLMGFSKITLQLKKWNCSVDVRIKYLWKNLTTSFMLRWFFSYFVWTWWEKKKPSSFMFVEISFQSNEKWSKCFQ